MGPAPAGMLAARARRRGKPRPPPKKSSYCLVIRSRRITRRLLAGISDGPDDVLAAVETPPPVVWPRDGGGGLRHVGHYSMRTGRVVRATSVFSGTRNAGQKQQTKIKEKGNEQVRMKAKRAGIRQERKKSAKCLIATQLSQPLCPVRPRCTCFPLTWALRAVPMACNLCAEQRKGDSGKTQERREEQRTRAETRATRDAHGALIEIKTACLFVEPEPRAPAPAPAPAAQRLRPPPPTREAHGARHRATGHNPPRRCCEAARCTQPWQIQRGGGGQQKEARANSTTKDKQFLSQLKHRARHERLASLPVPAVPPFALVF
jgi:hypothetical protein